jgi:hypothetical protein
MASSSRVTASNNQGMANMDSNSQTMGNLEERMIRPGHPVEAIKIA